MKKVVDSVYFYNLFPDDFDLYSERKKTYLDSVNSLIIGNINPMASVIDVGSGTGKRAKKIFQKINPSQTLCIDNAEGMVHRCRELGHNAMVHDISVAPLKDGQFDVALCLWNALGCMPEKSARLHALQNINQTLHSRGLLFLEVNNRYNINEYGVLRVFINVLLDLFGASKHMYEVALNNSGHATEEHLFDVYSLRKILSNAGFTVQSLWYVNYIDGTIERSSWRGHILVMAQKL